MFGSNNVFGRLELVFDFDFLFLQYLLMLVEFKNVTVDNGSKIERETLETGVRQV